MSKPAPEGPQGPIHFVQVLWDELLHLKRREPEEATPELKDLFHRIGGWTREKGLSALCFSGGGIRSATFNLGVIQAFAKMGLLSRFDYLSSVSGGGYIAGWLKAWLYRRPIEEVQKELVDPAERKGFDPLCPEAPSLTHLREYSNYLTPRVGLFSADTWTAGALIVRNLLLNWLVLLPALAAVISIPQVGLIVASGATESVEWAQWGLWAAAASALFSGTMIYHFRNQRRVPPDERRIVLFGVAPLWLSSLFLALVGLWSPPVEPEPLFLFCLFWCVGIPLLGWVLGRLTAGRQEVREPASSDLLGLVISGVVAAIILQGITLSWLPWLRQKPGFFVVLAVPILLGLYLLARSLFVAFASLGEADQPAQPGETPHSEIGYADREWWARLSGWVLLLAIGWMGVSALVVFGGFLDVSGASLASLGSTGLVSTLVTIFMGASRKTGGRPTETAKEPPSPGKELALRLAAPLTAAFLVVLLARFNVFAAGKLLWGTLGLRLENLAKLWEPAPEARLQEAGTLLEVFLVFLLVPFGFAALSWLLGWVVNVNRFSAQGLYRNRLTRAYLGASNLERKPDPFTGFDPKDNLPLHELAKGATPSPLPVINVTLNLVGSAKLAWQQRKAESFSMTPLYCGNFQEGYRRSKDYGGPDGISLGTAMTISGAAANPSAGYHSSPFIAFLLTLFNVRLGSWLGNPNEYGAKVFGRSGPRHAWKPLFADLLGMTDRKHAYVSLSDGGHFDNLGVYEMVLRRCRFIVASDAGQDQDYNFEELGSLVRKVRTDFGIPIDFSDEIRILSRNADGSGLFYALGKIHYECVDGPTAEPGWLLYVKPTLRAEGAPLPPDVLGYSRSSPTFPNEPTSDQWFTEAQFESYRALGYHLVHQLGGAGPFPDLPSLFAAIAPSAPQPTSG